MELQPLLDPVQGEMRDVDRIIRARLCSDVVLINELARYIVDSGGKRLRPAVVLLAARACGYTGSAHLDIAAIIEFIHTATLLHDDVVDDSALRRGRDTANALWGNEASVLTGDFLYSRSFQMMVALEDMEIMRILADTTNEIAQGEVLQLINTHNADLCENDYLDVLERKTARLFQAGARLGAIVAGCSQPVQDMMTNYGLHLGRAFQLMDDALDYGESASELGKNIGDDLAEGKITLPLIHAIRRGTPEESAAVRRAVENGGLENIDCVRAAIESTGAIQYTSEAAKREAIQAVEGLRDLPDSRFKESLCGLARFSAQRDY